MSTLLIIQMKLLLRWTWQFAIALKGENWDISHVEPATQLMIAGAVIAGGICAESGLLTVPSVLDATPSVAAMAGIMLLATQGMMTQLTPNQAH